MAAAVTSLASMSKEARDRLGRNGRDYLRAHFDKSTVIDSYERIIDETARR